MQNQTRPRFVTEEPIAVTRDHTDRSVTEVTLFASRRVKKRDKEGKRKKRGRGKNIKPVRQNRLTRAVVRHRVGGGRELDRSIGGISGVYTSAFGESVAWVQ